MRIEITAVNGEQRTSIQDVECTSYQYRPLGDERWIDCYDDNRNLIRQIRITSGVSTQPEIK
jgi:hypothetical protein